MGQESNKWPPRVSSGTRKWVKAQTVSHSENVWGKFCEAELAIGRLRSSGGEGLT